MCCGGGSVARCWRRLWRSWGIDAGTYQEKQVHEKDDDEDEATDEDVGPESHHGFVPGKVGRRDMVMLVAFVAMFGHAHKLTLQSGLRAAWLRNILLREKR
jgi:hypothetical protein